MSALNPSVPLIAITAEESDDENNHNDNAEKNIADALTDTEDLDLVGEKRKKRTRPHKQFKKPVSPDSTDNEEFEATDDEQAPTLVRHENPLSVDDVLDEPPMYEENYKVEGRGPKNRKKLKTQTSTSAVSLLSLKEYDVNLTPTDVEDFNDSDDEDGLSNGSESEGELLNAITQDVSEIQISDSVRKNLRYTASPISTPLPGQSGDEQEPSEDIQGSLKIPNKTKFISPLSMSPQLSDLTDTEVIHSNESNEEDTQYLKKPRQRRNRKNIKDDLTDTEDLYVSDNEGKERRGEVVLSDAPNFHIKEVASHKKSSPAFNMRSSNIFSYNILQTAPKSFKKYRDNLNTGLHEEYVLTEVEDFEEDELSINEKDEEKTVDDTEDTSVDNILKEQYESYYGAVEDKCTSKRTKTIYKTESFVKKRKTTTKHINPVLSDVGTTDEEDFENDAPLDDKNDSKVEENTCNIKFVSQPKKQKREPQNTPMELSVKNEEENILTDNEYLNSSDEEREAMKQAATAILTNEEASDDTESEGLDSAVEEEEMFTDDVLESCLPKAVREQIKIKETPDTDIVTVTCYNNDSYLNTEVEPEPLTDAENMSCDENITQETEFNTVDNAFLDNSMETEKTEFRDIVKYPEVEKESEGETDYEEITSAPIKSERKNTYLTDFLKGSTPTDGKLTDTEDFYVSDAENVDSNLTVREVHNMSVASVRTDMEEMAASDDCEEKNVFTPESSIPPELLNEISGTSIISKEGSGPFSKQERKKMYKRNLPVQLISASPMQTDTDEMFTSADDESQTYSRAETATPAQMRQQLDEASNSKVSTIHTKKIDLEAADEVMYIKGGGFISDQYTDVEDIGISEEEYHNYVGKNQISISVDRSNQNDIDVAIRSDGNLVNCKNGKISTLPCSELPVYASSVHFSLDFPCVYSNPVTTLKVGTPETTKSSNIFSTSIRKTNLGFTTSILVNTVSIYKYFLNMLYINIVPKDVTYMSTNTIGEVYAPPYDVDSQELELIKPNSTQTTATNKKKNSIDTAFCNNVSQLKSKFDLNEKYDSSIAKGYPKEEINILNVKTTFNIDDNDLRKKILANRTPYGGKYSKVDTKKDVFIKSFRGSAYNYLSNTHIIASKCNAIPQQGNLSMKDNIKPRIKSKRLMEKVQHFEKLLCSPSKVQQKESFNKVSIKSKGIKLLTWWGKELLD